jgi:SAM-dependent methyltransferase
MIVSYSDELLSEVAQYYSKKNEMYGETPQGVDWNGKESQITRFKQLSKIIQNTEFSLNDLGCGYGALFDFLSDQNLSFSYLGIDVSEQMIRSANQRYIKIPNTRFITGSEPDKVADYGIASGIFNVKFSRSDEEWYLYLKANLDLLNSTSRLGFSFNCLTSYSDEDRKQSNLYYANPCTLFDFCKRHYSKQVALLHDYGLYEFTILVTKE